MRSADGAGIRGGCSNDMMGGPAILIELPVSGGPPDHALVGPLLEKYGLRFLQGE